MKAIDIPLILSQQGGEAVYPLPNIKTLEVHPKLNLAAVLFAVKSNHLNGSHSLVSGDLNFVFIFSFFFFLYRT